MNGHQSDIKHQHLENPVAAHFNSEGRSPQELSIFVIEQIHKEEASYRRVKESYWMQTLWSLAPKGLNLNPQATKIWRNDGLTEAVLNLVDSRDNFRTHETLFDNLGTRSP